MEEVEMNTVKLLSKCLLNLLMWPKILVNLTEESYDIIRVLRKLVVDFFFFCQGYLLHYSCWVCRNLEVLRCVCEEPFSAVLSFCSVCFCVCEREDLPIWLWNHLHWLEGVCSNCSMEPQQRMLGNWSLSFCSKFISWPSVEPSGF